MSNAYNDADASPDSSAPGVLFQFTGNVSAYYTSHYEPLTFSGVTYQPEYIFHGPLEQSDELNKQQLDITVRITNPVAQVYIHEIPVVSVNVRVYRYIEGVSEHRLIWAGKVAKATFNSDADECVLTCDPIFSMLRRAGLRRNYQILCPYCVYDRRCGLNYLAYRTSDIISGINGNMVTSSEASSRGTNYYTGGVLIHNLVYHLIINHNGGTLSLASSLRNAKINDPIMLIAGCDKRISTCDTKFSNKDNFGGFPYIPLKNPFSGDSIGS
jgi:uncharacterized phage protein (TIGR02218 family)